MLKKKKSSFKNKTFLFFKKQPKKILSFFLASWKEAGAW